jgi:hypothetical protein
MNPRARTALLVGPAAAFIGLIRFAAFELGYQINDPGAAAAVLARAGRRRKRC